MNITHYETIIIGAGLTGLTLANSLTQKDHQVLIIEKSRGIGGRLATRRIDGQGLDHGAPVLDFFLDSKKFVNDGMNNYAKSMTKDLNILKENKVEIISKSSKGWKLATDLGTEFSCQNLILTSPLPQAIELLKLTNLYPSSSDLSSVVYSKALVLLIIAQEIPLELSSMEFHEHSFYFMRERNLHPTGIVFHLSQDQSELYFEQADDFIISVFLNLLSKSPLSQLGIEKYELKKWRYAKALNPMQASFEEVLPRLYLCGDGFGNPLESARALSMNL